MVLYNPLLMVFVLNIVTGTSRAFCLAVFMISASSALLFNVYKIHRLFVEHIFLRLVIEEFWIVFSWLLLLNIWM